MLVSERVSERLSQLQAKYGKEKVQESIDRVSSIKTETLESSSNPCILSPIDDGIYSYLLLLEDIRNGRYD